MKKLRFEFLDIVPKDWDIIGKRSNGFVTQSYAWARVYETLGIGRGRYLRVYKGSELIMQMLVCEIIQGGNVLVDYLPRKILLLLSRLSCFTTFAFHMSPVLVRKIKDQNEMRNILSQTVDFLIQTAKREKRNIGPGTFMLFKDVNDANKLLKKMPEDLEKEIKGTSRVHLAKTSAEMFKKIEYSRRKNIKRAERMGVTIKEAGIEEIDLYWKHLKHSWGAYKLSVSSRKYFRALPAECTRLFFAYQNDNLIGGNGFFIYGRTCIEFSIFITDFEKKTKTRGGDLIKWHMIEYCLQKDIRLWDLNMIDISESEEKTKQINFYKLEWGGDIVYGVGIFYLTPFMKIIRWVKQKFLGK